MNIFLTEKEYSYLCLANILPAGLLDRIHNYCHLEGDKYGIIVSEDEAEIIRDICLDRLDITGFDENYEPNQNGVILESLIDKFYK